MRNHLKGRIRRSRFSSLLVLALALAMLGLGSATASAAADDEQNPVEPQAIATGQAAANGGGLWVDRRSANYPIYFGWHYKSTVNNRTYYRPGVEFCVFSATTDEKIGCTRTNNRSRTSEQAKVYVPDFGYYYISVDGKIKLRDRPLTIPFASPFDGSLQYWNAAIGSGISCFGRTPSYLGTPQAEDVRGTNGSDVYFLGAGDDIFRGLGGNDMACAGNGNDTLIGGDGVDRLRGGRGYDVIRGDAGNDILVGGPARDVLIGGTGTDQCRGNALDVFRSCP